MSRCDAIGRRARSQASPPPSSVGRWRWQTRQRQRLASSLSLLPNCCYCSLDRRRHRCEKASQRKTRATTTQHLLAIDSRISRIRRVSERVGKRWWRMCEDEEEEDAFSLSPPKNPYQSWAGKIWLGGRRRRLPVNCGGAERRKEGLELKSGTQRRRWDSSPLSGRLGACYWDPIGAIYCLSIDQPTKKLGSVNSLFIAAI